MKGILGCGADWLQPGHIIGTQDGGRMRVLRKVDLAAAVEIAERLGDTTFRPVEDEHFYEVEVERLAATSEN